MNNWPYFLSLITSVIVIALIWFKTPLVRLMSAFKFVFYSLFRFFVPRKDRSEEVGRRGDFAQSVARCANLNYCYDSIYERNKVDNEIPEWYNILQKEIDRLPIGTMLFNPPAKMKIGVSERVVLRISKDQESDLTFALKGNGIPKIDELLVSEFMKVTLSGETFEIKSLSEEEQLVTLKGFSEWSWDVIPKIKGKQVISLKITLRIKLPFGEEKKDHPIIENEIVVKVNPIYSVKKYIINNYKWIITALIAPLIVWSLGMIFK
jgi:hypothetical protein